MAKHRIDIRGAIIPNDYKWFYSLFGEDSTCPEDVRKVLTLAAPGDEIDVYVNSGGGIIDVGSEIYTMLREAAGDKNVRIYITGQACSAASVIACAGYSEMSPTALMMVHCVSSGVSGNHSAMEHMAEVLRTADRAMCTAYAEKAGMTEAEALDMMEHETWLTAEQAVTRRLVDKIMFQEEETLPLVAGMGFSLPTKEQMEQARKLADNLSRKGQETGNTECPAASEASEFGETCLIDIIDASKISTGTIAEMQLNPKSAAETQHGAENTAETQYNREPAAEMEHNLKSAAETQRSTECSAEAKRIAAQQNLLELKLKKRKRT